MKKYKQVLRNYKNIFNKTYKEISDPMLSRFENTQRTINYLSNSLAINTPSNEEDQMARSYASTALKGVIDDLNNKIVHYFISDNSLIQFLKKTEIKDTSIINIFLDKNLNSIGSDEQFKKLKYYSIAIHTEENGYFVTFLNNSEKSIAVVICEGRTFSFSIDKKSYKNDQEGNFVINFVYYLMAFPEKIIDGVPFDMVKSDKKEKYCNTKNYSIDIAEEIIEKSDIVNGHIVSPHFRAGFFRHYYSDYYVNMKGKVKFIAATMVKGTAKTVVK